MVRKTYLSEEQSPQTDMRIHTFVRMVRDVLVAFRAGAPLRVSARSVRRECETLQPNTPVPFGDMIEWCSHAST